jgi:hypothetical protein
LTPNGFIFRNSLLGGFGRGLPCKSAPQKMIIKYYINFKTGIQHIFIDRIFFSEGGKLSFDHVSMWLSFKQSPIEMSQASRKLSMKLAISK